ncbi:MAG TPA: TIGR04086 family membrane protein [Solirubrobacterales bacterium]|nr:TIGR04086 family membrane protein [Solirubrobacterales bacterium]
MDQRTRERTVDDRPVTDYQTTDEARDRLRHDRVHDRDEVRDDRAHAGQAVRERQRDEYGGFNLGAAFFGWLVAVGIAVLLTALLSAAGAAIGLTELSEGEAESNAGTISLVGGILLIAVLAISYYAGGYVAGRMSRFDGGRQGLGVWLIGLLATVALAILGVIGGSEYNLFSQLNLPRIPIDEGSLAAGAAITLVLVLVATLVAAMAGGKVGERYHRKVDRAGFEPRRRDA